MSTPIDMSALKPFFGSEISVKNLMYKILLVDLWVDGVDEQNFPISSDSSVPPSRISTNSNSQLKFQEVRILKKKHSFYVKIKRVELTERMV